MPGCKASSLAEPVQLNAWVVVNGGIGSSYDEFALNQALIEREGATL